MVVGELAGDADGNGEQGGEDDVERVVVVLVVSVMARAV